jgi:3-isopropylmalate dehydrogenase
MAGEDGEVRGGVQGGRPHRDVQRSYTVAHLPGDGVGPEVTGVARRCVDAVAARRGFSVDWRHSPLGAQHYLDTGEVLPDDALADLRQCDAVLLGAVGSPGVPPGVLERGLLLRLRAELDLYINLRPSKLRAGVGGAVAGHELGDLDLVIVRENTEGLYAGAGGIVHKGSDFETATEESLNTVAGVRRCIEYAASLAQRRSGQLTLVHKTNVLVHAGDLWHRVARSVAAEADVRLDYAHVDAACLYLVSDPARFDVIVTDNLFGDILSDLAAALTGGLGYAPSGNLIPGGTAPSIFEPVHGSAPDIAGQGLANPAGAVLSAGLMLDHLGQADGAADLDAAVNAVLAAGAPASTVGWEEALLAYLAAGSSLAGTGGRAGQGTAGGGS